MKRQQVREHIYTYVCPRCNYQLPTRNDKSDDTQNSVSNSNDEVKHNDDIHN